jgi:hypothetical protein
MRVSDALKDFAAGSRRVDNVRQRTYVFRGKSHVMYLRV